MATVPDPLYGEIVLPREILDLAQKPIVQRLRHVRLSNIDSLAMPSIANISRFEHSLAVAFLCCRAGLARRLDRNMSLALSAAGLLHDSAITPLGHLAEEALAYVGSKFEHEEKWESLFIGGESSELGGFDLQLFMGRQSGLKHWAEKTFGSVSNDYLRAILLAIRGEGVLGGIVAGDIDLDNIDNVSRVAYHMGLPFKKALPSALAEAMSDHQDGKVLFDDGAHHLISSWLELRHVLYTHLMLAETDFAGKTMLLSSMVTAYERGVLRPSEWNLVDFELFSRLLGSADEEITEPIRRWLVGDLWAVSNLTWFRGRAPAYADLLEFSRSCTRTLKRPCFAYRIEDKRTRSLSVVFRSGRHLNIGQSSDLWLLGVCSPLRRTFGAAAQDAIVKLATTSFHSTPLVQGVGESEPKGAPTLFG